MAPCSVPSQHSENVTLFISLSRSLLFSLTRPSPSLCLANKAAQSRSLSGMGPSVQVRCCLTSPTSVSHGDPVPPKPGPSLGTLLPLVEGLKHRVAAWGLQCPDTSLTRAVFKVLGVPSGYKDHLGGPCGPAMLLLGLVSVPNGLP